MRKSRREWAKQEKAVKHASVREKVSAALDLPLETLYNMSQIQILENREIIVEGCKSILEYDDNIIRIAAKNRKILFGGSNLTLKCLNTDNIIIQGKIERIEFQDERGI